MSPTRMTTLLVCMFVSLCVCVCVCVGGGGGGGAGRDICFSSFSYFSQTVFDITCKLTPLETTCLKCQNLFSGKNKKIFQNNVVC